MTALITANMVLLFVQDVAAGQLPCLQSRLTAAGQLSCLQSRLTAAGQLPCLAVAPWVVAADQLPHPNVALSWVKAAGQLPHPNVAHSWLRPLASFPIPMLHSPGLRPLASLPIPLLHCGLRPLASSPSHCCTILGCGRWPASSLPLFPLWPLSPPFAFWSGVQLNPSSARQACLGRAACRCGGLRGNERPS